MAVTESEPKENNKAFLISILSSTEAELLLLFKNIIKDL
jgi:hypothetical protein